MTLRNRALRNTPWLNALLGMAFLLAAVLNITLLCGIGWATWQRATLSEKWLRIRQVDNMPGSSPQREAQALRALISTTQANIASILGTFPTDSDAARFISNLRLQATASKITIIELSLQTTEPTSPPVRRFALRAQGAIPQLLDFLATAAQTCPPTARLEAIALQEQKGGSELYFELAITVRPPEPQAKSSLHRPLASLTPDLYSLEEAQWPTP